MHAHFDGCMRVLEHARVIGATCMKRVHAWMLLWLHARTCMPMHAYANQLSGEERGHMHADEKSR